MKLRYLETKDSLLMLEWMHDEFVVEHMKTDFQKKTEQDCLDFIYSSRKNPTDLHLAIVDDDDTYMGTVSLKHIQNHTAEFGITIRVCAMGKGYAHQAMEEIIHKGFTELNLSSIYWCVDPNNKRAVRFYDKNLYPRVLPDKLEIWGGYNPLEIQRYIWYLVEKDDR